VIRHVLIAESLSMADRWWSVRRGRSIDREKGAVVITSQAKVDQVREACFSASAELVKIGTVDASLVTQMEELTQRRALKGREVAE
jgi:hypothetical protein